jgi:hypothetical protein
MSRSLRSIVIRGFIAALLLAGIAALAGHNLFPDLPTWKVTLYVLGGSAAAFAVVLTATVASLQFRQFVIRKGGTDTQWFWFSSEPGGLVKLREEARAELDVRSDSKAI